MLEACASLDLLEADFELGSAAGKEDIEKFVKADEEAPFEEKVIDPEADTVDELKDHYVGKVICTCNACKQAIFVDPASLGDVEDKNAVLMDNTCLNCGKEGFGFTIEGKVEPFKEPDTVEISVEPKEEVKEEKSLEDEIKEALLAMNKESITEDFSADIDVDSASTIHVSAESHEPSETEEMISPISDEDLKDLAALDNEEEVKPEKPIDEPISEEPIEEPINEEPIEKEPIEELSVDEEPVVEEALADDYFEIDNLDEAAFDSLVTKFARRLYENVDHFATTSVNENDENELIVEGTIKFNSGAERNTAFVLKQSGVKNDRYIFEGLNKTFSNAKIAFKVTFACKNNSLVAESLKYSLRMPSLTEGVKATTKVSGKVFINIK